jgi:hypothetical protein
MTRNEDMPTDRMKIDPSVLLPIALETRQRLLCDPEKWNDYEIEQMRCACGPSWSSMPLVNIRAQCCGLRKAGKLGKVRDTNNHGASKREQPPAEYLDYLKNSTHWKQFRVLILEWWGYKCALCNSPNKLDVHHRTYENLGHEAFQDCVPLCRRCHTMADRARKREKTTSETQKLLAPF